jgi:hypothetical protein
MDDTGFPKDLRSSPKTCDALRLLGLALHDQRRVVDKVLRGLQLHPLAPVRHRPLLAQPLGGDDIPKPSFNCRDGPPSDRPGFSPEPRLVTETISSTTSRITSAMTVLLARSYQGEGRTLDSPEGVCTGQAGFEFPATSVPFRRTSLVPVTGASDAQQPIGLHGLTL